MNYGRIEELKAATAEVFALCNPERTDNVTWAAKAVDAGWFRLMTEVFKARASCKRLKRKLAPDEKLRVDRFYEATWDAAHCRPFSESALFDSAPEVDTIRAEISVRLRERAERFAMERRCSLTKLVELGIQAIMDTPEPTPEQQAKYKAAYWGGCPTEWDRFKMREKELSGRP